MSLRRIDKYFCLILFLYITMGNCKRTSYLLLINTSGICYTYGILNCSLWQWIEGIMYLTDTRSDNSKILPTTIGSVINPPNTIYYN